MALAPHPEVVAKVIPEGVLIIDMRNGEYYTLEDVGCRAWQLCDGQTATSAIVATIAAEYDAPLEVITEDVEALLGELVEAGLLVEG